MDRVRVSVVGTGRFGKLHCAVLSALPEAELVAICDANPKALAEAAERFGVSRQVTDYRELLADPGIDAVFIVSPEPVHAEQALAAVQAGKHVFVEKPLAQSAAEARRIAGAAGAAGVKLAVGFILRFDARHLYVKEELDRGRFGELAYLRLKRNCSRRWFEAYGHRTHPVFETLVHDIDLALWLGGGPVRKVYAVQKSALGYSQPDTCLAMLTLASGNFAILETAWMVPPGAPANFVSETAFRGTIDATLEIAGTRQVARVELVDPAFQIHTDAGSLWPDLTIWPELQGRVGGALAREVAHFIRWVLQGGPESVTSVQDAVHGIEVADAIVRSAQQGREVALEV